MRQLDYIGIFWTVLSVECAMGVLAFAVVFGFLWLNLRQAVKGTAVSLRAARPRGAASSTANDTDTEGVIELIPLVLKGAFAIVSAGIALLFAVALFAQWDTYLRFRYGKSFGVADPLYGVDVGFYVFRLPFYEMMQRGLLALLLATLVIVVANYVLTGALSPKRRAHPAAGDHAASHISILMALLAADFGWGFYLGHYELLYSTMGVVYGAGFTAANVTRWALWGMVALSTAACALCALNIFRQGMVGLKTVAGIYVTGWIVGIYLVPALFQKFIVQPSELAMEKPYLTNYIDATRNAFQLDTIKETSYPALADLTPEVMARNQDTIQNIRLWDSRPLLQTFAQTQAIRLYYSFYDVATDRYHLADGYHQVMLSARELSNELPAAAQTWVNQYLQFTHGYGLVMNFVSKTVGGGFPQYLLENVPAQSAYGLNITQPAIYYGESMPGYRIVATGIKEFDYPKGNDNVYTSYDGKGGISLDSFWIKLLFAWTQKDVNILLTSYLTPDSRIQIWRTVQERVAQIAPFLRLDTDPYPVLSAGRLYWIQDAYTDSDQFPYSYPHGAGFGDNLNYIRNSVKVVVDMYDGTASFYVMDPQDPVLAVYRRAFPGVFKDLDQLSADLKKHLRYPEDLFAIQADQYKTLHMTDPQVFYNREDLWVAPKETYAGKVQSMEPYYILMKLPGSNQLQYLLMIPFTPQNRDNMISWMAAKCDFPEYGKMLLYQLPKEKLIYGPNQIEAMINQNTTISQQLTLWDQRGSRVIRGTLIVAPIENSFLYVVPLYLRAEGTNFPQLKRVIAVAGDKVVMEPTLDEALTALFGMQQPQAAAAQVAGTAAEAATSEVNFGQARIQFEDAEKAMQQGDWDKFGKAMDALKRLLAKPAT